MAGDEISPYQLLGGDQGVRALVDRFYDYMEELPVARGIRAMHPDDMTESRQKLYEFFSGWLGGPPLFHQRRGHPRLRARHLPFAIGDAERDAWMACMNRALADCVDNAELRQALSAALSRVADHMRNVGPMSR